MSTGIKMYLGLALAAILLISFALNLEQFQKIENLKGQRRDLKELLKAEQAKSVKANKAIAAANASTSAAKSKALKASAAAEKLTKAEDEKLSDYLRSFYMQLNSMQQ